jgi:hypothetical protein
VLKYAAESTPGGLREEGLGSALRNPVKENVAQVVENLPVHITLSGRMRPGGDGVR